jgi:nicotinate-nucleotide adenylyltransferase
MAAPIGILGGTFDPVHYGHLRLAQEVADKLRLAEVRFLPSGTPPHRSSPGAPAEDRLAMVRQAVTGNSLFTVDPRETLRSGPGYTVDTLTAMRAEVGPAQSLVLMLGADAFLELATWSRWHQLFNLAHVAVAYASAAGRTYCVCRGHRGRADCRAGYLGDTDSRCDGRRRQSALLAARSNY